MPSNQRRAAVPFILFTVFLDVLSLGVVIPVLPNLVLGFAGGATDHAARIYGWFATVWALMQFIASPVLGALSDRFGRRPIILLSCFGLGCDYLVMANAPSLAWLFVGRTISGVMAASFPTAIAYVADVTPPQERGAWFGKIGAAWGVGFIAGPAIGGFLAALSPRAPFWVAAVLTILNAAYGFFILPESLGKNLQQPFSWRRANPVGSLRLLSTHRELLGLSTVYFFLYLSMNVLYTVYVLYAGYRFRFVGRPRGHDPGNGRHLQCGGAGCPGEGNARAPRREEGPSPRDSGRCVGLCPVRLCADRMVLLRRDPGLCVDGALRPCGATDHVAARLTLRARTASGSEHEPERNRGDRGPIPVHRSICLLPPAWKVARSGCGLLPRGRPVCCWISRGRGCDPAPFHP